ncbi:hypothetical protein [Streptomyces nigrescens]|uniref:hypothetical protein n=1 Tax=Streptomyces nigrescens TaxID=1920 RepID=UPI00367384B6
MTNTNLGSARDFFAALDFDAPPYNPELHADDCEDVTCARCIDPTPTPQPMTPELATAYEFYRLQQAQAVTDGRLAEQRHLLDADPDTAVPTPGIDTRETTAEAA